MEFEEGVLEPTMHNSDIPVLFIIDDQMSEIDGRVTHLFVRGSHHLNISIIYILCKIYLVITKNIGPSVSTRIISFLVKLMTLLCS